MIAGPFGHEGLCQQRTKRFWLQRPSWPKRPAIIAIDSATYLLTISSPDIDKVAMSLYDVMSGLLDHPHTQKHQWM